MSIAHIIHTIEQRITCTVNCTTSGSGSAASTGAGCISAGAYSTSSSRTTAVLPGPALPDKELQSVVIK